MAMRVLIFVALWIGFMACTVTQDDANNILKLPTKPHVLSNMRYYKNDEINTCFAFLRSDRDLSPIMSTIDCDKVPPHLLQHIGSGK